MRRIKEYPSWTKSIEGDAFRLKVLYTRDSESFAHIVQKLDIVYSDIYLDVNGQIRPTELQMIAQIVHAELAGEFAVKYYKTMVRKNRFLGFFVRNSAGQTWPVKSTPEAALETLWRRADETQQADVEKYKECVKIQQY